MTTDKCKGGQIMEYVSQGPKTYSYRTWSWQTVVKVRGVLENIIRNNKELVTTRPGPNSYRRIPDHQGPDQNRAVYNKSTIKD